MNQEGYGDNTYYWGTLRITNPKTLEAWIHRGWFKRELDQGWIYGPGCGRFKKEPCTCHYCRQTDNKKLKERLKVIKTHYKK